MASLVYVLPFSGEEAGEGGEEREQRTLKKSSSVKVAMKKFSKGRGGGRR